MLVFTVLRNPSPALGGELNTLLLPGVQTTDRYPCPPPLPQTLSPSLCPKPNFGFRSVVFIESLSCFILEKAFDPLHPFMWSLLMFLKSILVVFFISVVVIAFVNIHV